MIRLSQINEIFNLCCKSRGSGTTTALLKALEFSDGGVLIVSDSQAADCIKQMGVSSKIEVLKATSFGVGKTLGKHFDKPFLIDTPVIQKICQTALYEQERNSKIEAELFKLKKENEKLKELLYFQEENKLKKLFEEKR